MDVLVITPRRAFWEELSPAFAAHEASLRFASTQEEAGNMLKARRADLAVLDLDVDAAELRRAVVGILSIDAMVNMASVCGMGEETFHSAMEGLGLIMDLPRTPEAGDVDRLLKALRVILG